MNAIVVLFALIGGVRDEKCVALAVAECAVPETKCCSKLTRHKSCRSLLCGLFGHRDCRPAKPARREVEIAPATDPGSWYVHRQLIPVGSTVAPNYSYTINHTRIPSPALPGVNKVCPASGSGFATIEQAAEAVLCLQSAENSCGNCTSPPQLPTSITYIWFTHKDGSDPNTCTYRINHAYSAPRPPGSPPHAICPNKGGPGYSYDHIGKATQAMVDFVHGNCPPCPLDP